MKSSLKKILAFFVLSALSFSVFLGSLNVFEKHVFPHLKDISITTDMSVFHVGKTEISKTVFIENIAFQFLIYKVGEKLILSLFGEPILEFLDGEIFNAPGVLLKNHDFELLRWFLAYIVTVFFAIMYRRVFVEEYLNMKRKLQLLALAQSRIRLATMLCRENL